MAQRFDQVPASEPPVKFTYNEKNPSQSYLCEDNMCKQVSPSQFKAEHPQEYADFVKMHPEYKQRMEAFDRTNPGVQGLPLTTIDGLLDSRKPGPKVKLKEGSADADGRIPLVLDPKLKGKLEDLVIPIQHLELQGPPEQGDSSVRMLPLDSTRQQYRLDSNPRTLKLDANGRLQFDDSGDLNFDPNRRLQFDKDGRIQLKIRPDGSDFRGPANPDDPLSLLRDPRDRFGSYGRTPQRRDVLEELLDPLGRSRTRFPLDPLGSNRYPNGLDALLDPFGQRRKDYFGGNRDQFPLDTRLRLPGQNDDVMPLRLNRDMSPDQLNDLYRRGGLQALPPDVRKQIMDQLSAGQVQVVPLELPQPAKPPEKPPEKQPEKPPEKQPEKPPEKQPEKPPEKQPEKPLEKPQPEQPAQPIDGPKPPTDLERPAEPKDQGEKLDAFGQSIKDTGAFTIDNFGDAYKEAAKSGSGVAIMVVGRGIPGSEDAIKNVKKLQEENPKLKFLIVDRDKIDAAVQADPKNSKMQEWKKWIDESTKACGGSDKNTVLTSVQSLKADASGYPAPEKVTSFHWNSNINQDLLSKAALASDATVSHAKEFRLSMDAQSATALASQIRAARDEALATPVNGLPGLQERQAKFVKALQAASQARPDLLAERRKEIDKIADQDERNRQLATLWELENAPRLLRAELGLDMVRSASSLPKAEKQAAMNQAGLDVLKDAYRTAPELKDNPEFAAALKAAGVNVEQLIKDAETASPVTSDQIKQRLESAYSAGDPVRVQEKRTEYRGNLPPETRAQVRASGGCCYSDACIRQKCCSGGICRRLCGRRR